MQYKCQECNDTGGRDKIGAYFDCNACDTAATRRDLNDFVKSLTQRSTYPVHPEDVTLAIHQRALSMAPNQEAPARKPVAYMAFADNGNIRVWAEKDNLGARDAAERMGVTLMPVYAAPAAANGALMDAKLPEKMSEEMREAMWEAITRHGAANLEYWIEDLYNDIRSAAIALYGAKGN